MRPVVLAILVGCGHPAATSATPVPRWAHDPAAWPRLTAGLTGTWHGTTVDGAEVDVVYRSIAGGTALAETFGSAARATMTLFHPDHDELVATHYCAQGNQPRLRATAIDGPVLRFAQADVTDLDPGEGQLVELTLTLGVDRFARDEVYQAPDGRLERTRWHFVRVAALPAER